MVARRRPNPEASAEDLRLYFAAALREYHGVPKEEERRIASNWQNGPAADLVHFDAQSLCDMFRSEAGILYGHVIARAAARPAQSQPK